MTTLPAGGRRIARLPGGMPMAPSSRRASVEAVLEPLRSTAAAVAATAAVLAGVVLAGRRLAGGFTGAEPGLIWLTLGGSLVLLGLVDGLGRGSRRWAPAIAARVGLLVAVAAVTLPPRHPWASILALGVAAAVGVLPPPGRRRGRPVPRGRPARGESRRPSPSASPSPVETASAAAAVGHRSAPAEDLRAAASTPLGVVQQRLERFEAADGTEGIAGHVRLSIPLGGRATQAHVGFCPAFVATPIVEVSTDYDGVEAVVTAAEVLPWGVRIECRLSEPAEEPLEIPVTLVARSPR